MPDYRKLQAADARAGVADPDAAVPAIKALRDNVTVDVAASDIRSELWRTREFGKLEWLYVTGARGDFGSYPAGQDPAAIFGAVSVCLSFLNSPAVIRAADSEDWQAVLGELGALVALTVLQQSTLDTVTAKRAPAAPTIADDFNSADVLAARSFS
jgi:hypothetical protein